uniref:Paired domain-containing protein n=1 Tax=Ditylenchus dipsaci TaxID=166011 RepID=A0A915E6G4_9BILA
MSLHFNFLPTKGNGDLTTCKPYASTPIHNNKCRFSPSKALLPSIDHFNKTFKLEDSTLKEDDLLLSDGQSPTRPVEAAVVAVPGAVLQPVPRASHPLQWPLPLEGDEEFNLGSADQTSGLLQQNRSSGINQLGRTYSPGLPLSMSEREQIIDYYRNGWKSVIFLRFRTTGTIQPKDAKEGRQQHSRLPTPLRHDQTVRNSEQLILDGVCKREMPLLGRLSIIYCAPN